MQAEENKVHICVTETLTYCAVMYLPSLGYIVYQVGLKTVNVVLSTCYRKSGDTFNLLITCHICCCLDVIYGLGCNL